MTPERIKSIRAKAGENVATFGARFSRSGRTVEQWEQGRRNPDPLAIAMLVQLEINLQPEKRRRKARRRFGCGGSHD